MRARRPKGLDALAFDILLFVGLYFLIAVCVLCVRSVTP